MKSTLERGGADQLMAEHPKLYYGVVIVGAAAWCLSVLFPVYNERYFVGELMRRVLAAPFPESEAGGSSESPADA